MSFALISHTTSYFEDVLNELDLPYYLAQSGAEELRQALQEHLGYKADDKELLNFLYETSQHVSCGSVYTDSDVEELLEETRFAEQARSLYCFEGDDAEHEDFYTACIIPCIAVQEYLINSDTLEEFVDNF